MSGSKLKELPLRPARGEGCSPGDLDLEAIGHKLTWHPYGDFKHGSHISLPLGSIVLDECGEHWLVGNMDSWGYDLEMDCCKQRVRGIAVANLIESLGIEKLEEYLQAHWADRAELGGPVVDDAIMLLEQLREVWPG